MKVLITSGGTKVPIDSVRHIGNMSSGTFGAKIAQEALKAGHDVTFLMAKDSKSPLGLRFAEADSVSSMVKALFRNIRERIRYASHLRVETYCDFVSYEDKLWIESCGEDPDVVVLAAAVSDFGVAEPVKGKIRTKEGLIINLVPLPKLISRFAANDHYRKPRVLVGFKLLVDSTEDELVAAARKSIDDNGCDMVVANDLRDIKASRHKVLLVYKDRHGERDLPDIMVSRPNDPNGLAREVVAAYTRLYEDETEVV